MLCCARRSRVDAAAPVMTMTWREFKSPCFDRASTLMESVCDNGAVLAGVVAGTFELRGRDLPCDALSSRYHCSRWHSDH